jgi:hypothetical protein
VSASPHPHTWIRWAAAKLPWDDELFSAAWMIVVGLVPDSLTEIGRQLARMQLPVEGTHPETIAYLLRRFGLPSYQAEQPYTASAGYLAVLARLRDAWATHAIAGSLAQLNAELVRAGFDADAEFVPEGDAGDFYLAAPSSGAPFVYDAGADYDEGNTYDRDVTPAQSQGLAQLIRYFAPARSRFVRIQELP